MYGSKGIVGLIVGGSLLAFATGTVVLRIISRRMMKVALDVDDYMIVVALIFAHGCIVCSSIGVVHGAVGIHVQYIDKSELRVFFKNIIATILLWASACTSVKLSLLFLYIRVFSTQRFRNLAYTVMVIVVAWWLSVFLGEFLLCRPFAFSWDQEIKDGSCGNVEGAYLAAGVVNLCTDVLVLCLPIHMLVRLHLPLRNRIALLAIFGVGFLVCIISCLRIAAIISWRVDDPTYTMWPTIVWSESEATLGIICACVPLMRPIFGKFFSLQHLKNSGRSYNMMCGDEQFPRGTRDSNDHTYPLRAVGHSAIVQAGKSEQPVPDHHSKHDSEDGGLGKIQVVTRWNVHYTADDGGIDR